MQWVADPVYATSDMQVDRSPNSLAEQPIYRTSLQLPLQVVPIPLNRIVSLSCLFRLSYTVHSRACGWHCSFKISSDMNAHDQVQGESHHNTGICSPAATVVPLKDWDVTPLATRAHRIRNWRGTESESRLVTILAGSGDAAERLGGTVVALSLTLARPLRARHESRSGKRRRGNVQ
jgi:hypothetical protein